MGYGVRGLVSLDHEAHGSSSYGSVNSGDFCPVTLV